MVDPLRQMLIARKLFAKTTTLEDGKFEMDYDTVTEMGEAIISYDIPDNTTKRDDIAVADASLKLAVISKGWKIPYSKWRAYLSEGKDLSTTGMTSAMQVCALLEEKLLLQSWKPDGSNARINGLYASAGNNYSTSKDFGTYGNAKDAVAGVLSMMADDDVPTASINWNYSLNPTQYYELEASESTSGIAEMEKVLRMLNPAQDMPPGQIIMSPDIAAGTGLVSPVDPAGLYIEFVKGKDMNNVLGTDSKLGEISPVYGTTYEVVGLWVKHANAIGVTSAI
jgi:uncharacterized linocin/CFP29 family protein